MKDDTLPPLTSRRKSSDPLREIFSATLRPYRSLSKNGFIVLMLLFGGTCFCAGVLYVMVGAWPIFVFFGLDVLAIYIAFKVNYYAARAFEEVIVRDDALLIRRVSANGSVQEICFNPYWVKLHLTRDEEECVTKITVTDRGENADLGQFLNPDDKTSFARAFSAALSRAKA